MERPPPEPEDASTNPPSGLAQQAWALLAEERLSLVIRGDRRHEHLTLACDAGGIALVSGGQVSTAAATEPAVAEADQLQLTYREGPCLDGDLTSTGFIVEDLLVDERWPRWSAGVATLGWRSLLTLGLAAPAPAYGVLNLYSRRVGAFTREDLGLTEVLAEDAATVIAQSKMPAQTEQAARSRSVIGQAQRILMERYDLDAQEAFAVLTHYSSRSRTLLREVAEHVVDTLDLPED